MKRYLVLAEGRSWDPDQGKTAYGVIRYSESPVVAAVNSERAGQDMLGVPIVATVEEAVQRFAPTTALVGIAPAGGVLSEEWRALLRACIAAGLDIESGLHIFLSDDEELSGLAAAAAVKLLDLRRTPTDLEVLTGSTFDHPATVVFTVGSDCSTGKMTVCIELDRAARAAAFARRSPDGTDRCRDRRLGIAVDAVVSDFVAGAAQRLVLKGAERADLLWVEGQGSIVNAMYSGVTLRPLSRQRASRHRALPQRRADDDRRAA